MIDSTRRKQGDFSKAMFIESLQKQVDEEIFKEVTCGLFNYFAIVLKERKNTLKKLFRNYFYI